MKVPAASLAILCLASTGCQAPSKIRQGAPDSTTVTRETRLPNDSLSVPAPHPEDEEAWFSFTDSIGGRLICRNPDSIAPVPYFVATAEGTYRPLRPLGKRTANPDWNHRATAREFDRMGGHVFAVEGPPLEPDQTYLVASASFAAAHRPLSLGSMDCQGLAGQAKDLEPFQTSRRIRDAWILAHTSQGNIGAMVYQGNPPLAGLFLAHGDSSSLLRFEGVAGGDSSSVWRVDDGGVFDGCALRILAAFHTSKGLELAYAWPAFEGETSVLMRQAADTFAILHTDSRYWSP